MLHDMLTRPIGKSGINASSIGLGTWAIGGWMWGGTDEALSIETIHASIDEGVSLIDTAPAYGQGLAEEIVGKALKGRRDKVILATKCGLVWHTKKGNHFFDYEGAPVQRYLGKDSIIYEVEESLKRLGTDYIDHYITHWQDPTTSIDETMEALEALKASGKIRSIGASNTAQADVENYLAAGQLDAIQEEYSMIKRGLEQSLLPTAINNNVAVLSYSSLALGMLSGKMTVDRTFGGDDQRKDNPRFSKSNREKVQHLMDAVAPVAQSHDATLAQTVIAWTLQQPGITFSLCGARTPEQARENAKAGRIRLSEEDVVAIKNAAEKHLINLDG